MNMDYSVSITFISDDDATERYSAEHFSRSDCLFLKQVFDYIMKTYYRPDCEVFDGGTVK